MKRLLVLFAVVMMCSAVANAQLITSHNFNYTDNSLLSTNGWVAHSSAGAAPIAVGASNGLTYTDYSGLTGYTGAVVGNAAKLVNTGEDVADSLATPITTGTIYYSFLVNVTTGTAGYFVHLGGSATSFASRIYVKPSATLGKINFGISNTNTASYAVTPTNFDTATVYLIIVKYDVSATGAGSLWVKASGVPLTEVAAGTPEHTTTASGQASINRICLRQYSVTQSMVVDGIRMGTTWNDAPLPVELTSFNAIIKGKNVELVWNTATETNNYGFEIEKRAMDNGQLIIDNWNKIGFVEGNGTTNAPKSYSYVDAVSANGKYSYRLKQIDRDGKFEYSQEVEVVMSQIPQMFALMQNYPNPFNPTTAISYQLSANSFVTLKVYDMLGKEVASLVNEVKEAGTYSAKFDGSSLSSGIYFYTLKAGNFTATKKLTLMK